MIIKALKTIYWFPPSRDSLDWMYRAFAQWSVNKNIIFCDSNHIEMLLQYAKLSDQTEWKDTAS